MRCTVEVDNPLAFAMPRELQCVAWAGTLSSVRMITASIRASSTVRGALVPQAVQPVGQEAPAPLANRHRIDPQPRRASLVGHTVAGQKNDPSPKSQSLGRLAATRERLQLDPLTFAQNQRFKRTTHIDLRRKRRIGDYEPNL